MKKFSTISGEKVNEEPSIKIDKKEQELLELKANIRFLLDSLLTIRSNGSARQELIENSITISGKEYFVEALIELFGQKSITESIVILEDLKLDNRDWLTIDNKINVLNQDLSDKKFISENINQFKKVKNFIDKYGEDERFEAILDLHISKVNNKKEAYLRSLVAEKMSNMDNYGKYNNTQLKMISEKYLNRAKNTSF